MNARLNSIIRNLIQRLPANRRLPLLTRWDVAQGCTEPENIYVPAMVPPDRRRRALDIGANNGVTTGLMAPRFACVDAFEPHPILAADLRNARIPNCRIHEAAVSARSGSAELMVPVSKGVVLTGWSSLTGSLFQNFEEIQRITVATVAVDELDLTDVDYVKIDVEGHELETLRGALATIQHSRPWMVIEALGSQQEEVTTLLTPLGYTKMSLHDLSGIPGSTHNMIFVPRDVVPQ